MKLRLIYSISDHAAQRIVGRGLSMAKVRRALRVGAPGRKDDLLTYTDHDTGCVVLVDPRRGRIVTAYYRARVRRQEITQEQSPCP